MYWRSAQPYWSAEKTLRSDAKAVRKIVGDFLKCYGNRVQVLGFSHWMAKLGWLCGARQIQKNVSLRSR
jgi:hypothetical protein